MWVLSIHSKGRAHRYSQKRTDTPSSKGNSMQFQTGCWHLQVSAPESPTLIPSWALRSPSLLLQVAAGCSRPRVSDRACISARGLLHTERLRPASTTVFRTTSSVAIEGRSPRSTESRPYAPSALLVLSPNSVYLPCPSPLVPPCKLQIESTKSTKRMISTSSVGP